MQRNEKSVSFNSGLKIRKCQTCKKDFMPNSYPQKYCNKECNPKKKTKLYKEFECKFCHILFLSKMIHRNFCCNECERYFKEKTYTEKWIQGNSQENHDKKVKNARRIQPMLNWSATEVKDPVNRKLKVMRG